MKRYFLPLYDADTTAGSGTATPQAGEQTAQQAAQGDNTNQTGQAAQTQQATAPQTIKIKYNHEEKEIPLDEATNYIQKGMNYDKVYEQLNSLQSNPALGFVENLAKTSGMTIEQYIEAANKQIEQDRLNQLIQQNIPEDLAKEIMANRQFRQQYEAKQKDIEAQEKRNADYQTFVKTYPDIKPETIPGEVWNNVNKGMSLVDAYTRYENQKLKAQMEKLTQSQQTQQTNQANAASSTGSVTGQGTVPNGFISKEEFEKHRGDMKWVKVHLDELNKSMSKWNA